MIGHLAGAVRKRALGVVNDTICKEACRALPDDVVPSFIVVTPHLVHLAPLAARNHTDRVRPVFVANGIRSADIAWLEKVCAGVPVIGLRSSLRTAEESLLEHGIVINHLVRFREGVFCIQDADCFVTDRSFWSAVTLDLDREYAAGPFMRSGEGDGPGFPETFLLCLNARLMREYGKRFGITAECAVRPPRRARKIFCEAGYPASRFLDSLKDYYDTLHQYWIVARHQGYGFRSIEGAGELVHHIGGTSYLHRSFENLSHWDFWPLNVHYLHMRLLELPACARFRDRFERLFDHHGSAEALLASNPAYADGWRRRESDRILEAVGATVLYAPTGE